VEADPVETFVSLTRVGEERLVQMYDIRPLPGLSPTIGRLVAMPGYARETTLRAVEGLTATSWITFTMR
jgi:hypothetical protein